MRCALPVILILLLSASPRLLQPELVIVIESTKQYHRASCELLRKQPKDVIAMNVGQAELRGYKEDPACDPSNPANKRETAPGSMSPSERAARVYVYTAAGDTRYHRETCAKLAKPRKKVLLEEAGKKLWPCPTCRPPIRKRTPAVPPRYGRG
jgi:hypothetical protein